MWNLRSRYKVEFFTLRQSILYTSLVKRFPVDCSINPIPLPSGRKRNLETSPKMEAECDSQVFPPSLVTREYTRCGLSRRATAVSGSSQAGLSKDFLGG